MRYEGTERSDDDEADQSRDEGALHFYPEQIESDPKYEEDLQYEIRNPDCLSYALHIDAFVG